MTSYSYSNGDGWCYTYELIDDKWVLVGQTQTGGLV